MLNICYDYQIFAYQRVGGISRYFARLIESLSRLDESARARVVAPIHQNQYLKFLPGDLVRGFGLRAYPPGTSKLIWSLNEHVSRNVVRNWMPDILHRTYYATTVPAFQPKATVVTVFDMIHELFSEEFAQSDTTIEQKRIAVEKADHVICISENTRNDLISILNTAPDRVTRVYLGFDNLAPFGKTASQERMGRPFLLYVGARGGYKNFEGLLRAVTISKNLVRDFDLVAFGGGHFSAAEIDTIKRLGFRAGQVRQMSGGDDLLAVHYDQACAFVYPSLYEGFGLPPLEAMAHKCPVISSNTSSLPEVISNAAEFFDPRDVEQMAEAIERVVYSEERTGELVEAGTRRVKEFSWERCARETLAVYERLI